MRRHNFWPAASINGPIVAMAAGALCLFLAGRCSAVTYSVTDVGPGRVPTALNNAGQVVGYTLSLHAFLYSNGTITDLNALGGFDLSRAYGINDLGQVVGVGKTSNSSHAFLYSGGTMHDLGSFIGPEGLSVGNGINNSGQIVGRADAEDGAHAFVSDGNDMDDLGTLPDYTGHSEAFAINAMGEVVGSSEAPWELGGGVHAFLYNNGAMHDLGAGIASAINDLGQVTGYFPSAAGPAHAFLYSGGSMQDLGSLIGAQGQSEGNGINNLGQIVGRSDVQGGPAAFLYSEGTMFDLNSLVVQLPYYLTRANAINNAGQIVAQGGGHALLLTPIAVPEPSTLVLCALAMAWCLLAFQPRRTASQ